MQHSSPPRNFYNNSNGNLSSYNVKEQCTGAEQYYFNPQYSTRLNQYPHTFWNSYPAQLQQAIPNPYFAFTQVNYQPMTSQYSYPYRSTPVANFYSDPNLYACFQTSKVQESSQVPEVSNSKNSCSNASMSPANIDFDANRCVENLLHADQETVTKFIVESCLKAEAIAGRNQYRPCFKNIQNLCSKTRSDILKPRNTAANIHSQGIPWVTKDFICAFVRLVNTWYTLKGYIDERNGSLGKIESALSPEFKECYLEWETLNKKMISHLAYTFVTLDYGVTVQNAKIYTAFKESQESKSCNTLQTNETVEHPLSTVRSEITSKQTKTVKPKEITLDLPKSPKKTFTTRGIIRLKDVFDTDDSTSGDEIINQNINRDGESTSSTSTPSVDVIRKYKREAENTAFWQAVDKLSNLRDELCENMTPDILKPENLYSINVSKLTEDTSEQNSQGFANRNSNNNNKSIFASKKKEFGLSNKAKEKFENMIGILMDLQLIRFIISTYDKQEIPSKYKYIGNPIHLLQIKENLKQSKYLCPEQVVYDFKSILNESKTLSKEKPDWKMDKSITNFSRELEFQLAEKFPTFDFSDITGETTVFVENSAVDLNDSI